MRIIFVIALVSVLRLTGAQAAYPPDNCFAPPHEPPLPLLPETHSSKDCPVLNGTYILLGWPKSYKFRISTTVQNGIAHYVVASPLAYSSDGYFMGIGDGWIHSKQNHVNLVVCEKGVVNFSNISSDTVTYRVRLAEIEQSKELDYLDCASWRWGNKETLVPETPSK